MNTTDPAGVVLKRAADAAGVSLRELARRTGLPVSFLSEVTRGLQPLPLERVATFAAALALDDAQTAFLREAAWLDHAPAEVRHLVARLRERLAVVERSRAHHAAEAQRLRRELDAERRRPR